MRNLVHWLVVNIKGHDITTGQTIAEYIGSGMYTDIIIILITLYTTSYVI